MGSNALHLGKGLKLRKLQIYALLGAQILAVLLNVDEGSRAG